MDGVTLVRWVRQLRRSRGEPAPVAQRPDGVAAPDPSIVDIRFADVRFRYPNRRLPAVELNAIVHPGETVLLTGPAGCGKSTALAMLLGMAHPMAGEILVGDAPLSTVDICDWRSRIACVAKRPWIFAGTVADNIRLGDSGADDAAVQRAARDAGAERFIDALPDGFATVLNDDDAGISIADRRRIALAHAFLRDSRLVLLDEPTQDLDAATAAELTATIRRLAVGRTMIIATRQRDLATVADRQIELIPEPADTAAAEPSLARALVSCADTR